MYTIMKVAPRIAISFGVREALIWLAVAAISIGAVLAIWAVFKTSVAEIPSGDFDIEEDERDGE